MMKLRFLCGTHRAELARNPRRAVHCWQDGFDTGLLFCEQQMWHEALPHLGCAFETAEILLTTKAIESHGAYELFASSAGLLITVFRQIDYPDQAEQIYWMAVKRLTAELHNLPAEQTCIAEHLEQLYKQLQQPEIHIKRPETDTPYTNLPSRHAVVH